METTPWGGLVPGPFPVGFKTAFATDHSRRYLLPGEDEALRGSRPVWVAVWYPASGAADAAPLTYGDYLDVSTDNSTHTAFASPLAVYLRDITIQYGLEKDPHALDEAGQRELAERLRLPLRAVRDALPAPNRFPIVFYHPGLGGSYEDNGVLCEYLASYGYLVVSSAYQSEAGSLHVDWDLDRSLNDLRFLMNVIAADAQADLMRVGAVGQSYGAQALLAWSSEPNAPVQAVVSLDSTVEYAAPDAPGLEELRKRLSRAVNVTAAWLLFAVGQEKPNWSQWDYLANPRWLAETGPMQHNDFTAQGLIGTVLRHPDTTEATPIRERYDAVCDTTRRFLDACLKNDPEARRILERQTSPQDQAGQVESPLTLTYCPPSAPDIAAQPSE